MIRMTPGRWPVVGLLIALALTGAALLRPDSTRGEIRSEEAPRVVMVVAPGLSWEVALDLMARGKLPVLAEIIEGGGAIGDLVPSREVDDAEILASIVTGRFGFKHGVRVAQDLALFDARPDPMRTPVWESIRRGGGRAIALGFPFGSTSSSDAKGPLLDDAERHLFLLLDEAPGRTDNPESTRAAIDRYYQTLDDKLAGLLAAAGTRNTTWMLVSGQAAVTDASPRGGRLPEFEHRRESGFFLAWGHGIKRTWLPQTIDPVDVTPTVLYLAGCPIPNDMDGIVLFEILDDGYFFKQRLAFSR